MIRCVLFRNGCWGLERLVATIRCSSRGPEPMCAAHYQLVLSCIGSPGELMPSSGLFWHPQTHGFQHVYWKNQGETAFWTSGIKSSLKFYQGAYLICQCTAKRDTTDWVIGIKQNDALLFWSCESPMSDTNKWQGPSSCFITWWQLLGRMDVLLSYHFIP